MREIIWRLKSSSFLLSNHAYHLTSTGITLA